MRLKNMAGIRVSEVRLRYLYEVSRQGSMQAASEKLNVAPSSVSRQLSQLESELGIPLLERGQRKVKLTEAGNLAVRYYREHMSHEEALLSQLQDLRGLKAGKVKVAVGEGFVNEAFSAVLHDFCSGNAGLRVKIEIGSTNSVLNMVVEDEAHLGITLDAPAHPKIRVRNVTSHPIHAVFAPDHALAESKSLSFEVLAEQQLALPDRGFRIRQLIQAAEQSEGVFFTPQLTSNSILILKNFALSGGGVTLLPQIGVASEIEQGTLVAVPIKSEPLCKTSSQIVTRLGRQLAPAPLRFMQGLEASLKR